MLNLKQLSKDYNVSQIHLGEIMGVSQSAVSLMMRGTQKIKYEHIEALIDKFGKEIHAHGHDDRTAQLNQRHHGHEKNQQIFLKQFHHLCA